MLDKKAIGKRIEQIKNSYTPPLTYAEFGARLRCQNERPIPRGTVNSWVRGLCIPSRVVVEQIALIGNVTAEWIYTGKTLPKLLCMDCQEILIIETNNTLLCPKCCLKYELVKQ
ncbi:transcriptional regulator [Bacillus cereus]|nr:transcriptional regulator [Bacillus cereus]